MLPIRISPPRSPTIFKHAITFCRRRRPSTPRSPTKRISLTTSNRRIVRCDRPGEPTYYGANTIDIEASYEVDFWGRISDQVKAAKAQAQASKADLESVRIGLQAELARDYVSLRGLDREARLLQDTVKAYKIALDLTRERLTGKIAAPIDVARAEVQFENAKAVLADIVGPRAAFEHAIATLSASRPPLSRFL